MNEETLTEEEANRKYGIDLKTDKNSKLCIVVQTQASVDNLNTPVAIEVQRDIRRYLLEEYRKALDIIVKIGNHRAMRLRGSHIDNIVMAEVKIIAQCLQILPRKMLKDYIKDTLKQLREDAQNQILGLLVDGVNGDIIYSK